LILVLVLVLNLDLNLDWDCVIFSHPRRKPNRF
jgi:hypothetical protein